MYRAIASNFKYNYALFKVIRELLAEGRDVGHYAALADNLTRAAGKDGYHTAWVRMVRPGTV